MFIRTYRLGSKKHSSLIVQQRTLNSTRASLLALRAKLRVADKHLETTRDQLSERLRGVGLFTQRLVHLALAPAAEVPRILKSLPNSVVQPQAAITLRAEIDDADDGVLAQVNTQAR